MKETAFLGVAFLIAFTSVNGLGAWLLPLMGLEGIQRTMVSYGVALALAALLYFVTARRPGR